MARNDAEYFAKRALQERKRADCCSDSSARRVHQEMAERYKAKVIAREPQPVRGNIA